MQNTSKNGKNLPYVFEISVLMFVFEVNYAMFCLKINKFPLTHYLNVFITCKLLNNKSILNMVDVDPELMTFATLCFCWLG